MKNLTGKITCPSCRDIVEVQEVRTYAEIKLHCNKCLTFIKFCYKDLRDNILEKGIVFYLNSMSFYNTLRSNNDNDVIMIHMKTRDIFADYKDLCINNTQDEQEIFDKSYIYIKNISDNEHLL